MTSQKKTENRIIGSERVFSSDFISDKKNNFLSSLSLKGGICLFSSGRSAIRTLFTKVYTPSSLLLPAFDCDEVEMAVKHSHVKYFKYSVKKDFCADMDSVKNRLSSHGCDAIYIVDYYGLRDLGLVSFARKSGIKIIIDRTHSLFNSHKRDADYEVGSFRKLFPVPDGGFLTSKSSFDIGMSGDIQDFAVIKLNSKIKKYIYNRFISSENIEHEYLNDSVFAESLIDDNPHPITSFSSTVIEHYDIKRAVAQRINNREALIKNLNRLLPASVSDLILQSFPVFVPERDFVKSSLYKSKIFLPVLWRGRADFQNSLLNIPIDEEYSEQDMLKVSKALNRIFYDTVA